MFSKSLISIVIPCYNDADYIEQSVQSALDQTYSNKEVIVIDDGSDEKTKIVLKNLEPKIDILITQENKGLGAARNAGIEAARGELILVQDSDDSFDSNFCQKAVTYMSNYDDAKIISCYANLFDENGNIRLYKPKGGDIKDFLFHNSAIGNSLFKKKDFLRVNGYDEEMKDGYEDWEFYIRILLNGGKAYIIEEPLFNYRQKKDSLRRRANKVKYELWKYIFLKHQKIYSENFEDLIGFFVRKIEWEEREKIKNTERLEFRIGSKMLFPLRFLKKMI